MSIIDDKQKWACEYCTYLNFPSAQKCTICRSNKPLHLIIAHGQDPNLLSTSFPPVSHQQRRQQIISESDGSGDERSGDDGGDLMQNAGTESRDTVRYLGTKSGDDSRIQEGSLDIYRLASTSTSTSTTTTTTTAAQIVDQQQKNEFVWDPDADKWPCTACTYLNYPRSLKCTQCGKRRYSIGVLQGAPQAGTAVSSGRNSRTNSNAPSGQASPVPSLEKSLSPPPTTQQRQHPNLSPPQTSSTSNATLDSRIIAKKLQKWTCASCTYENWPKSSRCVMCYTQRASGGSTRPDTPPANNNVNTGNRTGFRSPQPASSSGIASATAEPPTTSPDAGKEKKRSLSSGKESGRKSPKNSSSSESVNSDHSIGSGAAASCSAASASSATSSSVLAFAPMLITGSVDQQHQQQHTHDTILEKTMRRLKKQLRDVDYLWLTALKSIAMGGLADCCDPVEAYFAAGGDPARCLTHGEVHILNRSIPSASFESGQTLFHLAMRYRREDLLTLLLACTDRPTAAGRQVQRVPCHMSPESAADIRRQIHMSLRQRKGEMAAYFFTELATFSLPSAIYDLPPSIQAKLFDALLDRNVQKKLEEEYPIINWSVEVTDRLGSRLFALWNRMCGDCLLDSVLQATWGVFDSENSLRQALSESLSDAADVFYPRWREYETYLASLMHYTIEEDQFARDWDLILQLASKPGAALEQAHIFVLAHIIRRPIIVYGVRVVKSYFSGESIDYARFEGIYLPLLWESSFCWRSPICLSYTPGHFTALVPMEPDAYEIGAIAHVREFPQQPRFVYLPLKDSDGQLLPIHFLNANERGHEQALLRAWLDVCMTEGGLWCCKMRIHRLPPSVQQMIDDWLDYYRRLAQLHQAASAALTRYNDSAGSSSGGHHQSSRTNKSINFRKAMSPTTTTGGGGGGGGGFSAGEENNAEAIGKMESQKAELITGAEVNQRKCCSPQQSLLVIDRVQGGPDRRDGHSGRGGHDEEGTTMAVHSDNSSAEDGEADG